jgi:NAD dependent epimerase/dehydratase
MDWQGRTALVTGAAGFIGSHLVETLVQKGGRVRAMLHYDARPQRTNLEFLPRDVLAQVDVVAGDILDPFFVQRAVKDCQVVFHLAALIAIPYSYVAPSAYAQANVVGTVNVLEACRLTGVQRIVHTSTSECYGTARYVPIDEEHPLQGQSPYSASKIGAEKIAESFCLSFGTPVVVLRPFNTFGPRQSARAVIASILSQLVAGRPELHLGDTEPIRDMNYVANTVDGFLRAASRPEAIGQVINLATGVGKKVGEIAELAMKVVGRQVPIVCEQQRVRPEKSEVRALIGSYAKAEKLLGWTPQVSLEQGLEETARFVRDHLPFYRPEDYVL